MELLLIIAGWIAWAIVVALTYIVVPFIIWKSTQDRNLPVALEPIVYWSFLIPGSFLFSLSDINKFHIIWVFLLFGIVGWWINDNSYKWEYDDKKWITKVVVRKLLYGTDYRTPRKFVFLWVLLSVLFLATFVMKRFIGPVINTLIGTTSARVIAIGIVGILGVCIVLYFLKAFIDNIRSDKCILCRKYLHPLSSGKSESESISIMVQAGSAGNVGYVCLGCGNKYCQRCMESNGGALCPNCGSPIKYLKK